MPNTFFLDPINGNDANDGTTFANRWKRFDTGATAARIAPGDTIRVIASPEPTLIGDCAWLRDSRTITLPSSVTQMIDNCDSAWTASANVTATAGTTATILKQGTGYANLAIASGFTTGKVAYRATGALDLSGYQQVSFWLQTSAALAAGVLELRLCTDGIGAVTAHTIAIPASASGQMGVVTYDFAGALSAGINSIALWALSDPGTITIRLDCILACKASSSADALTLTSLIGKAHNLSWAANTAYGPGAIRRPTQPNRNGWAYKRVDYTSPIDSPTTQLSGSSEPIWPTEPGQTVADGDIVWECHDLEQAWYPILSIDGTAVRTAQGTTTTISYMPPTYEFGAYSGVTETVATYKREPMVVRNSTNVACMGATTEGGTAAAHFTVTGGWNRTDMSTQTGETWVDGGGNGVLFTISSIQEYWDLVNMNAVRFADGIMTDANYVNLKNCHAVGNVNGVESTGGVAILNNVVVVNNGVTGITVSAAVRARCIRADSNATNLTNYGGILLDSTGTNTIRRWRTFTHVRASNNYKAFYGLNCANLVIRDLKTRANQWVFSDNRTDVSVHNWETEEPSRQRYMENVSGRGPYLMVTDLVSALGSFKHVVFDNGLLDNPIYADTSQRYTASGYSWRLEAYNGTTLEPLRLPIARVLCTADQLKTISLWVRRNDSLTGFSAKMLVEGGQIAGVPDDVSTTCEPAIDTWTQYSLTFTPTEDGVVEVLFLAWGGNAGDIYWIDDLEVT